MKNGAGLSAGVAPKGPPSRALSRFEFALVAVLLAALILFQYRNPSLIAHRLNERGMERYQAGDFAAARKWFEEALALGVKPERVRLNLGDSELRRSNFASAHDAFQTALTERGDFLPAAWNDGFALHAWGLAELDTNFCRIERTEALWQTARERFRGLATEKRYARDAATNVLVIEEELRFIRMMHESNKDKCAGAGGGASKAQQAQAASAAKGTAGTEAGSPASAKQNKPVASGGNPSPEEGQGGGSSGGALSESEIGKIRKAQGRIQEKAEGASFRQSSAQQMRQGPGRENRGKEVNK